MVDCWRLMVIVRKKQRRIKRAITTKKIKLDRVSKPSQVAKVAIGSGKIAIIINTIGKSSQAIELLTERVFFFRQIIIKTNKIMAAMVISI